jgi:hypothetical protein
MNSARARRVRASRRRKEARRLGFMLFWDVSVPAHFMAPKEGASNDQK